MALLRAPSGLPLRLEVLRPDDLVFVAIDAHNLALDTADPANPRLRIDVAKDPALLVVWFQPQSITEKAYFETAANIAANPPPVPPSNPAGDPLDPAGSTPAIMAGPSRLVFRLPPGITSLPFSSAALLDWSRLELVVSPTADGHVTPPPLTAPTLTETALELPYRLVLSPSSDAGWVSAGTPQTHAGRTELWHTRLGSLAGSPPSPANLLEASLEHPVPLRAVWSPDFVDHGPIPGPGDIGPIRSAMTPRDRMQLVILTSGFSGYFVPGHAGSAPSEGHEGAAQSASHAGSEAAAISRPVIDPRPRLPAAWVPQPVQASRVFLSTLGGWLTSRGEWSDLPSFTTTDGSTQSLDLDEWIHVATQARDHYVRIVYEGYLYPFGHRAALVKVTERKVKSADGSTVTGPTAYLRQHMYIVVREREKTYDASAFPHVGREMPFLSSVRIETAVTPDIDAPTFIPDASAQPASFWIDVGGSGFPFHVVATDLAGSRIDLLAQLIFVDLNEPSVDAIAKEYVNQPSRRPCEVHGQKVAYADPGSGDTVLRTTELEFDSVILQHAPPYPVAPFIPTLSQATVTVPALEQLLGLTTGVDIALYDGYLTTGLDGHAGVYASLVGTHGTVPPVTFTADKAGGLATPNVSPTALSARKGVVAGPADDAAQGVIDPAQFFGGVSIPGKLFGAVPLSDLIKVDSSGTADASQNAPEIRTKLSPNAQHPQKSVTTVTWQPTVESYNQDPLKVTFHDAAVLALTTTITRDLQGGAPSSKVNGELSNFTIDLLGVIGLTINSLTFKSESGSKPTVSAKLPDNPIAFEGPLAFVQTLASILPPGMFGGSGVAIKVSSTKITATLTIGLPSISIGVFSLEHISVMTGLDLPFIDGKPGFEFGFAKRSSPFLLTIECLGGGGFVHLIVNADGVQMVEGALEFGGEFSLDVGVASGGVHIMAGIYFQLKGHDSDLTGFVDIGGEVSVLGIISVSIDLNLSLSYQTTNGKSKIEGKATMTVSVHVLFFSASVSISVERSFGSSSGDPKVDQLISAGDWATYAAAFA
ncbi:MAG TPA: hypothetical protein VGI07_04190 [Solirubrobacteraceae bacterium]|jgi:hypothetical protein